MKSASRRNFLKSSLIAAAGVFSSFPSRAQTSSRPQNKPTPDWPSHGWDISQTRFNANESTLAPTNVSRLKLSWEFEAGSGITGTPAVAGNRVVFGSWDGKIYAL